MFFQYFANMREIDTYDSEILRSLQQDSGRSLDEIAEHVHLSRNAVWRRIRALEADGVIRSRVALLDPDKLGLGLTVFMAVRTQSHSPDWLERFSRATRDLPEILSAYRMTGDLDYLIKARVKDMQAYDALYQALIRRVEMHDVSASFVMEELKDTTALPV